MYQKREQNKYFREQKWENVRGQKIEQSIQDIQHRTTAVPEREKRRKK